MKRFVLMISFILLTSWFVLGQSNPGFETNDLTGWIDNGTGTEAIVTTNNRTGLYALSYSTNNATNQRLENTLSFSIPNNYYLHVIAWSIGNNTDAQASIAINTGSTWSSNAASNIGTTLTQLNWKRQNSGGATANGFIGLNSSKVSNATILYWDDVIAYVSSSPTTDLVNPDPPSSIIASSSQNGTSITITWNDGNDNIAGTGSQEVLILRTDGLSQTSPSINNQGQYSIAGGSSGPNSIGIWAVIGIVSVGIQTFIDNSTSPNNEYTYAVFMRDAAFNYSIGSSSSITALPVELSSFSANVLDNAVKLNWRTETEVSNYGFEILRQAQDDKWDLLGFIAGYGNSNSPKDYSFIDQNVSGGKYSYRLKQIDTDGKFEYSKVIEVDLGSPTKFELSQNYPNPFNPVTTINFSVPQPGNVKLTVYNILGEEVTQLVNGFKEAGMHTINFSAKGGSAFGGNASGLPSGGYIYRLEANGIVQSRKMILLK